ncbi:TIGR03083 family protein [Amycolatopsis arida]|uniref:TIGR03083 family protein n=1 Tax=Amycolatopsis arida TaxID=587909 RepID=A0A1I5YB96_9PSEU|nr:uncharacterized protein (TIGR03083 family) [Amycolatopsis arida]SFQ41466.1 TIGR03083 family protein [Amycolatopsis arida]
MYSWVCAAIANPSGEHVEAGRPPEEWSALLDWWDERRRELLAAMADPERPAWLRFSGYQPARLPPPPKRRRSASLYPQKAGSWARRQAHETAIHRLDAELAAGGETVAFDPEFAADGIEEFLVLLLPDLAGDQQTTGSVLVHAEDTGRMWSLRLEQDRAPATADPEQPFEPDLTIAGPAGDVYRALWGRPHRASLEGDTALLEPLRAP